MYRFLIAHCSEKVDLQTSIMKIYSSAEVCLSNGTCLAAGEFGIKTFFKTCKDPPLLAEAWKKWRDQTGRLFRADWLRTMQLNNMKAREHGG